MKTKLLLTISLFFVSTIAWAQKSKTFKVCDVTVPSNLLPTESYQQHLEKQLITLDANAAIKKAIKLRQYHELESEKDSIYLYSFNKKMAYSDTASITSPTLLTYADGKKEVPLLTHIINNNSCYAGS